MALAHQQQRHALGRCTAGVAGARYTVGRLALLLVAALQAQSSQPLLLPGGGHLHLGHGTRHRLGLAEQQRCQARQLLPHLRLHCHLSLQRGMHLFLPRLLWLLLLLLRRLRLLLRLLGCGALHGAGQARVTHHEGDDAAHCCALQQVSQPYLLATLLLWLHAR